MNTLPKEIESPGWHPADVKAGLEKKGYSFRRIAREHGYSLNATNKVLFRPWSQVEAIISEILEVPPSEIWPERYVNGRPRLARAARVNTDGRNKENVARTRSARND